MKHIKMRLHSLSIVQVVIIILSTGLLLGILFANVFRDVYETQLLSYQTKIFTYLTENPIDHAGLFRYVLIKNIQEYLLFWLLCITVLGIPYMVFKIISFGFFSGFLISVATMQYGIKGLLFYLAYEFPHGIIYLPVAILCLYKGYELCRAIYHGNHGYFSVFFNWLVPNIFLFLLLTAGLVFGSYLEAYAGSFLFKKALQLFI